jgi:hypothetical protein
MKSDTAEALESSTSQKSFTFFETWKFIAIYKKKKPPSLAPILSHNFVFNLPFTTVSYFVNKSDFKES